MKKYYASLLLAASLFASLVTGCGSSASEKAGEGSVTESTAAVVENSEETTATEGSELEDGIYTVKFDTDSGMFHVNEAMDGKGKLTVEDGKMTVHISLVSKKIKNLYPGLAEDAQKDGAEILEPTVDTVTYSDGFTEEVFGFDVPVPYLDQEFDLALVGEKGTWYDHKVSVSEPTAYEEDDENGTEDPVQSANFSDGAYLTEVTLEGGSGRATVESPAEIRVEDGKYIAVIKWSSPYYDFMVVDGKEYQPVNEDGNSVFEIPVESFDAPIAVQADTIAMSKPHLIDYTLIFSSDLKQNQ